MRTLCFLSIRPDTCPTTSKLSSNRSSRRIGRQRTDQLQDPHGKPKRAILNVPLLCHVQSSTADERFRYSLLLIRYFSASDPPTISASSSVICDCRARLYCRVRYLIISPAASVAAFIATIRATCSLRIASLKY